ncbi:MAG TPA: hypothetical protein DD727_09205 [Clostridiales bacterium]|nr:hypothetical protein [Clostridiales bacterium]
MKNLSTKEVNYVKDILSWELLSSKKCFSFANQEKEPNRQKLHFDVARAHQTNYVNLLNYLSQTVNSQKGQMQ